MNLCGQCNTQFSDGAFHSCQPGLTLSEAEELVRHALERAYLIARGHADGDGFAKHGARQLYWKGRSDAAKEIREVDPRTLLQQWQKERNEK